MVESLASVIKISNPSLRSLLENTKLQIKTEDEKSSQTKSKVAQVKERLAALETDYYMEKSAHQKTKKELENAKLHYKMHNDKNGPIHIQLRQSRGMIKCLENDLHSETFEWKRRKKCWRTQKTNIEHRIE